MKMYQVDAFTDELFKGNPAAVMILQDWLPDQLMQNIALENNLSETAFVKVLRTDHYEIRWFTPFNEMDFCGHATLASAFVLFKEFTSSKTVYFYVKDMGIFTVQKNQNKIMMNFPVRTAEKISDYPSLLTEVIDKHIKNVYLNTQAYIVELETSQDVETATPVLEKMQKLNQLAKDTLGGKRGIALTASGEKHDCVSRYFSPNLNFAEDPVTGSLHTAIAPLWSKKLKKDKITAYQASPRGGTLYCEMLADDRMIVSGYARLYLEGEIALDYA